jgi:type-F conjugative transfer system pilin assembly protein TrbC
VCSEHKRFASEKVLAVALGMAFCALFSSDAPGGQGDESRLRAREENASAVDMTDVKVLENRAKECAAQGIDAENPHRQEAEKQAEALFRHSQSDSFRAAVKEEERRVREILSGMTGREEGEACEEGEGKAQKKETAKDQRPLLSDDERIYVFISSSVPMRTLRNYARDIDRVGEKNISFVMRGFVGGMGLFGPTAEFLREVVGDDPGCWIRDPGNCRGMNVEVSVDPMLFRAFGVEAVPAIAYARGGWLPRQDRAPPSEVETADFYMVYGDASLTEALEVVNRVVKARSLARLLRRLGS